MIVRLFAYGGLMKLDVDLKEDARGTWVVITSGSVSIPLVVLGSDRARDVDLLRQMIAEGATFTRSGARRAKKAAGGGSF